MPSYKVMFITTSSIFSSAIDLVLVATAIIQCCTVQYRDTLPNPATVWLYSQEAAGITETRQYFKTTHRDRRLHLTVAMWHECPWLCLPSESLALASRRHLARASRPLTLPNTLLPCSR